MKRLKIKSSADTYWFDTAGNTLKPKAEDKTLPDTGWYIRYSWLQGCNSLHC